MSERMCKLKYNGDVPTRCLNAVVVCMPQLQRFVCPRTSEVVNFALFHPDDLAHSVGWYSPLVLAYTHFDETTDDKVNKHWAVTTLVELRSIHLPFLQSVP